MAEQLSLFPELIEFQIGQRVRATRKYPRREWPGGPTKEEVAVFDGVVVSVVVAGQKPTRQQVDQGWFTPSSRASQYDRVIIRCQSKYKSQLSAGYHRVVTIDKFTKVFALEQAE